jgi:hypothetical protein
MSCEILDIDKDDSDRVIKGLHLYYSSNESPFKGFHENGNFEMVQGGYHKDINPDSNVIHLNRTLGNNKIFKMYISNKFKGITLAD